MAQAQTGLSIALARAAGGRTVHRRHHVKPDGRDLYLYGYETHVGDVVPGEELAMLAGSELRRHPLRNTWSIYAAARNERTFKPSAAADPLAPSRPGEPLTEIPFGDFELCVFANRFPGLHADAAEPGPSEAETARAAGACEVVVYGPEGAGSLATLGQARRRLLVEAWIDRYEQHFAAGAAYVLPFENRGEAVGVTLAHPHGQIYAFPFVPEPQAEAARAFAAGYSLHDKLAGWRTGYGIAEAGGLLAYAPPFARFPYEAWISGFARRSGPWAFGETEADGFAHLLGEVTARYDALFGEEMPFMLSLQAAPFGADGPFEFTAQFYPLLRAPGRVKYLASVEQATGVFTVDILPEVAAARLRAAL